jgi:hypothetical protein
MFTPQPRSIVVLAYNKSIEIKMSEEIKERRLLPPRTKRVEDICAEVAARNFTQPNFRFLLAGGAR